MKQIKKIVFTILFLTIYTNLISQIIENPTIDNQDEYSLNIDKIEFTDNSTILYCTHTAPDTYKNGGWVRIEPTIYLKESKGSRKYKLLKAEGVPLTPKKFNYSFVGQTLSFRLIFQKIASNISSLDLIECRESNNCFNFYGINILNNDNHEDKTSNKFRVDYDLVSIYDGKTEKWGDFEAGNNTFVINMNSNGDIMHIKANNDKVIYKKLSGADEGKTDKGDHYQTIKALDEDGNTFTFQIFDDINIGLKMIYGDVMIQFTKE